MTERVALLTEKERACLRLVWEQHSSKQIAEKLGINFHAVDGRIKSAVQRLGAVDRYDAARQLAQVEGPKDIRLSISEAPDVPSPAPTPLPMLSSDAEERRAEHLTIEESQASYRLTPVEGEHWFPPLLPVSGRERNDLKPFAKLFQVVVIAVGTALLFRVLADSLQALSR